MRSLNYRLSYLPPFSADLAKFKYTRESFKLDFLRNEALHEKRCILRVRLTLSRKVIPHPVIMLVIGYPV